MAQQIKNTFLKSKMNKDLDDRILPNGEYRDARNISVGRSEDNDVGAIENIIGNDLLTVTELAGNLTIIGLLPDNATNKIYVFLTDYTDPNPLAPTDAPATSLHYIYVYNNSTSEYNVLVQGNFLNFSTTNRIIGVNLIENLLFWTDNRNQPRKININPPGQRYGGGPNSSYYTQEHQISVAKYSPYQAIKLYNSTTLVVDLPGQGSPTINAFFIDGDIRTELTPFIGATVLSSENGVSGTNYIIVESLGYNPTSLQTIVNVSPGFPAPLTTDTYVTLIKSTMTNEANAANWPGDPDYLEDRFVRFSYRFKYDDNEYSLMAPFTQIAYIPKQKGYFLNGDEDAAYQSTVVSFMENMVQNIGLVIPLPINANRLTSDYKISEIEILFRESDSVAVKVLESLDVGSVVSASGTKNTYTYEYQSRKPYKTLPEAQTTRVYDRVPIRAFSQESSGNRIIYGNYRDQHTPPSNINYNCRINEKDVSGKYTSFIEYPNHSVKRNRNYQVGFVLADKFGRQSPVILSSVDTGVLDTSGLFYFGSTIYSSYDELPTDTDVKFWFGDAITLLLNAPILSTKNLALGTPGLYAIEQQAGAIGTGDGFAINTNAAIVDDTTYRFSLNSTYTGNDNIPRVGDSMRGAYEDFVIVENITGPSGGGQTYTVTTSGRVSDVYLRTDNLPSGTPDIKFAYLINDLGWYSYKIVVKQTEQEYYNVYLPGILNGYPGQSGNVGDPTALPTPIPAEAGGIDNGLFPSSETNRTAFTVLFNDNINKIPRDLTEVGPDQKQYRSSVTLYGRVTNIMTIDAGAAPFASSVAYNAQYFPRVSSKGKVAISHTSTAIARAKEVNMGFSNLSTEDDTTVNTPGSNPPVNTGATNGNKVFYQLDTNPLISRISTIDKSIGATALNFLLGAGTGDNLNVPLNTANMTPYLAIYETEPVESLLDIYWETTSEGLIVDLNAAVLSNTPAATSFQGVNWDFSEGTLPGTIVTPGYFVPADATGNPITTLQTEATIVSQTDANGDTVELFSIVAGNSGDYALKYTGISNNTQPLLFTENSKEANVYSFVIKVDVIDSNGDIVSNNIPLTGVEEGFGALKNLPPTLATPPVMPAFETTIDNPVLIQPFIPTPGGPKWTAADPKNGTANTIPGVNIQQLQFRITTPTTDYPDNWEMNINTGELTQLVPGDILPNGETFNGNPNGVYPIEITVTDANGAVLATPTDYEPKSISFNTSITMGTTGVNPGALTQVCVVDPANPGGGTQVITSENIGDSLNAVWLIVDPATTDYNYTGFFDDGATITPKFIGTEAHTRGTILFSICTSQEGNGSSASTYNTGNFRIYYRKKDEASWELLSRNLEYNQAGIVNSPQSMPSLSNWPDYISTNTTTGYLMRSDSTQINKFTNFVRAVDYPDLPSDGLPIEYAIIMEGFGKASGLPFPNDNRTYAWVTTDDVHNPSCLPWWSVSPPGSSFGYGINAADSAYKNSAGSYEYYRSSESTTFPSEGTPDVNNILFAETPYAEYVNQLFTNAALTTPYVPSSGQSIRLQRFLTNAAGDNFPPSPWTNSPTSGATAVTLTWSVQYSSIDGLRVDNADQNIGCKAGLFPNGETGQQYYSTSRIKN